MKTIDESYDVVVIGGGPAGSIAAAKLVRAGFKTAVLERTDFPRFVIGESLLPECNRLIEEADMLEAVQAAGFQVKPGAAFEQDDGAFEVFHFNHNLGQKWGTTFQVKREMFDKILLDTAAAKGADVYFGDEVVGYDPQENLLDVRTKTGDITTFHPKKVIDASGYGRVLARLLNLESDSRLKNRRATFCRVQGDIRPTDGTDGYIYIYVYGDNDAWIWNIPFSDGTTSVGIVCSQEYFESFGMGDEAFFDHVIGSSRCAAKRYAQAKKINAVNHVGGYSSAVTSMFGEHYVMVGNATEFLDPVFSSGVTLALESGSKAADLIIRELNGGSVDWQREYHDFMMLGIGVFREFVLAWYDGRLQKIFFAGGKDDKIVRSISSVLAGYVWDGNNAFVKAPKQTLDTTLMFIGGV